MQEFPSACTSDSEEKWVNFSNTLYKTAGKEFTGAVKLYEVDPIYKTQLWNLIERLLIPERTLMGEGFRHSLGIVKELLPIQELKFESGSKSGSWTVPREWIVKEAYIAEMDGTRVVDYRNHPFHLWQYSKPFRGELSREDLLAKVATCSGAPSAIPLHVTYYGSSFGFSLTELQKQQLRSDRYQVVVDTELFDGHLSVGELFLPGETEEEILLDGVLSSPALGNNMSGVAVAVYLMQLLTEQSRRHYSYRLVLTPETLGPITLHHQISGFGKKVVGGFTFVNLADSISKKFHYRMSRLNGSLADQAMIHALTHFGYPFQVEEFDVRTGTCGNEKAYNSLGIEIPIGSIRRSHLCSYPEYDTHLDDLDFIDRDKVFESFRLCWGAIQALERNVKYRHRFEGEPFLSGYGMAAKIRNDEDRLAYDYLMGFTTGQNTLIEIAERARLRVDQFDEAVDLMKKAGLLEEARGLK